MSEIPSPDPKAPAPAAQPACALVVMCVECGHGLELSLPLDPQVLAFLLAQAGWFVTVMEPPSPGAQGPMLLGPLCTACAQRIYSPEVFAGAEQRRQQLLRAAQEAQAAYEAQNAQEPR